MRFKPDWPATVHVTDVSVWPWRRLRKTAAAWVTRGFWEVESLSLTHSPSLFLREKKFKKKKKKGLVTWLELGARFSAADPSESVRGF